jgi:hypothetical protein
VELTVTRSLLFNPGRYEKHEISFTIAGIPVDTDPQAIAEQLDMLMAPEIERAALATSHDPADNATSIYVWQDIVNAAKEGAHA